MFFFRAELIPEDTHPNPPGCILDQYTFYNSHLLFPRNLAYKSGTNAVLALIVRVRV